MKCSKFKWLWHCFEAKNCHLSTVTQSWQKRGVESILTENIEYLSQNPQYGGFPFSREVNKCRISRSPFGKQRMGNRKWENTKSCNSYRDSVPIFSTLLFIKKTPQAKLWFCEIFRFREDIRKILHKHVCIGVVVDYAYTVSFSNFSIEYLPENEKVRETVFACSYATQVKPKWFKF